MTHVQRSALLPYSVAQMYQLVNDVDSYPKFVPWCVKSEVHAEEENKKKATIYFASRGIRASVTTCNELVKNKNIIVRLVKGPFKHLTGSWQFIGIDESSCRVEFDMEFTFSNRLYEITLGPIFNQVANKLVSVFAQRASVLYGG
jgi:ribosome-associated toxin RatA of RatAB toxin-antitoxin module